ncbi:UDP-4-amino-4,6-dideoxy-N-acetyl-beta-L-altrosamine transaminase [Selenomonas ruminantium]|uniref:UDP-4-amino-4, 6-dideoxy-N-acetyl-beta-L-altrosamine transaminase n=1 Tax=Selenomonas ruminantium TaxID=971 RepID=UPI000408518A|nr:UDP-4-amino-4,6-dideoxy-N-acetyl-beta-L-altrosamine transaminase [Selenomonas ruminantium]
MIPYSTQCIEQDDIDAVVSAMKNEFLTGGPLADEFANKFAEHVGAKYAVAVSSGTAALHAACAALDLQPGDEIITTANTWVSSANAVFYAGGRPVFADIDPVTYNIDPKEIEKHINKKTRAIIPVHYAGQPCAMDEIQEIADQYNLKVIEDAAHGIEALYKGEKIGSLSDITTFSFHPIKQMTTCEGGMVTTNDPEIYRKVKLFKGYGIVKDEEIMQREGRWAFDQASLGYNYRLSDVQCALGISQLNKVRRFVARRREIAKIYDCELAGLNNIVLPKQLDCVKSSYFLYPILVEKDKHRQIYEKFRECGIGVGVSYPPVYKNSYYQKNGYRDVCCPNSEDFYAREISLPIHSKLTDDELIYVIDIAKKILD